jgi:hypothetical protein
MNVATLDKIFPQAARKRSLLKLRVRRFLIVRKLVIKSIQPMRDIMDTTRSTESRARPWDRVRLLARGSREREGSHEGAIVGCRD